MKVTVPPNRGDTLDAAGKFFSDRLVGCVDQYVAAVRDGDAQALVDLRTHLERAADVFVATTAAALPHDDEGLATWLKSWLADGIHWLTSYAEGFQEMHHDEA